ncbi:MAG: response regulator, partial [Xanthomonadales bacterium]|nr:response regulator [Xanthomonadales bacterium]
MSAQPKALIVDDEAGIRELLSITLGRLGLAIDTASNLVEARQHLAGADYDLCFTDMRLPDGNGHSLIEFMADVCPNTP